MIEPIQQEHPGGDPVYLRNLSQPVWAVFSDFDESWLAHNQDEENALQLRALEDQAAALAKDGKVAFAWVSGCTLDLMLDKCRCLGVRLFPHYIAASHGGELVRREAGRWIPDPIWSDRMDPKHFAYAARLLVDVVNRDGVLLRPQIQRSACIRSYYLPGRRQDSIPELQALAEAAGLTVSISPSNVLAGDPEDTFDVDFTPGLCSKREVVEYLLAKHGVPRERSIAFGDNVGDIGMLEAVGQGYLLGNANPAAKARFAAHLQSPYARGIRECLAGILSSKPAVTREEKK